jgi:hypothetical protein
MCSQTSGCAEFTDQRLRSKTRNLALHRGEVGNTAHHCRPGAVLADGHRGGLCQLARVKPLLDLFETLGQLLSRSVCVEPERVGLAVIRWWCPDNGCAHARVPLIVRTSFLMLVIDSFGTGRMPPEDSAAAWVVSRFPPHSRMLSGCLPIHSKEKQSRLIGIDLYGPLPHRLPYRKSCVC